MLGQLSAAVRGGLIGAAIVGAFAAGAIPAAYQLGRSHERGDQVTADYQAVVDSVEDQATRLAEVAATAESRLTADREWRSQHVAAFLADSRQLAADAAAARRAFHESQDRSCPAGADDASVFNAALGLAAADNRAGDP